MAKVIRVNGEIEELEDTSLESLQKTVGGFIEIVPIKNGKYLVCNEEGKLQGLVLNEKATEIYESSYDCIVGDAVLCNQNEIN